ncbi:MAG: DUF1330 domain-containing protein [Candidatus Pelagibacter sp. TMED118]|nr:MAG: DUF1330 domain-containing protein [Candidatus Pelagibacter sp. TMED118]|tara:strand:+ start:942 stop:1229 length:288 start_codon:yes stop_codon:yes gene_type:complete
MKAYWVCIYEKIKDEGKLKEYALKAMPALKKYSGKILARGGKSRTNEGIDSPRTVVIEFPNYETAKKCYDSSEYQEAHNILKNIAIRHHQIVEGS